MPVQWVELVIRIRSTLDLATRDLSRNDLMMFDDALHSMTLRRMRARDRTTTPHPQPAGDSAHTRDPSGP
ncbi:hypothetical protein ES703_50883 [subsurface metagenome]